VRKERAPFSPQRSGAKSIPSIAPMRTSDESRQRRQDIERRQKLAAHALCRNLSRPPGNARHAQATLMDGVLCATERRGRSGRSAFRAVIASEDDERIFCQSERTQLVENSPHAVVEFLHDIAIQASRGSAFKSL